MPWPPQSCPSCYLRPASPPRIANEHPALLPRAIYRVKRPPNSSKSSLLSGNGRVAKVGEECVRTPARLIRFVPIRQLTRYLPLTRFWCESRPFKLTGKFDSPVLPCPGFVFLLPSALFASSDGRTLGTSVLVLAVSPASSVLVLSLPHQQTYTVLRSVGTSLGGHRRTGLSSLHDQTCQSVLSYLLALI